MKKLFKVLFLLLLFMLIVGGIIYFMPQYSTSSIEPDFKVQLTEISTSFENDEASASSKYIGKVVATQGTIREISHDQESAPVILLSRGKNSPALLLVTLEMSEKDKVSNLKVGDKVKIKGQCTGKLLEVVFKNGILLD